MAKSSTSFKKGNKASVGNKSHFGECVKWDPKHCETILPWAAEGWSREEIASELGIVMQTWYDWEKVHPEWLEASTRADQLCLSWWQKFGRQNLKIGKDWKVQEKNYALHMMNRFKWNKKTEDESTTKLADAMALIAKRSAHLPHPSDASKKKAS